MTDVKINNLIKVARDFVKENGIDADNSQTINNNRELSQLLAGTGADSIEKLQEDEVVFNTLKTEYTEEAKALEYFFNTDNISKEERLKLLVDIMENLKGTYSGVISDLQNAKESVANINTGIIETSGLADNIAKDMDMLISQYEKYQKDDLDYAKLIVELTKNGLKGEDMQMELFKVFERVSSITRQAITDLAEMVYNHDKDLTAGVEDADRNPNGIKRSSFKTQDKIYTLRGKNVMISDYSGKLLSSEPLDSSKHPFFFE